MNNCHDISVPSMHSWDVRPEENLVCIKSTRLFRKLHQKKVINFIEFKNQRFELLGQKQLQPVKIHLNSRYRIMKS